MKIIEDLGQILVVLHTLLVIIEMTPRLNKQSGFTSFHISNDMLCNNHTILFSVIQFYSQSFAVGVCDNLRREVNHFKLCLYFYPLRSIRETFFSATASNKPQNKSYYHLCKIMVTPHANFSICSVMRGWMAKRNMFSYVSQSYCFH